ncbi:MAG: hypothetical protein RQ748_05500 [Elusimicrobiales bacterium]|nr:hypothetical protein [Elusimicrobiales bacterium]
MDIERAFNLAEAALWFAAGLTLAGARRGEPFARMKGLTAAAAALFVLFGLSDLAEMKTGAWWAPAWLLAWKTVNGLALLFCVGRMYYIFKTGREEK